MFLVYIMNVLFYAHGHLLYLEVERTQLSLTYQKKGKNKKSETQFAGDRGWMTEQECHPHHLELHTSSPFVAK